MTVQAGVEISLELLVGDMPEVPCEQGGHGAHPYHPGDGSATYYFRGQCRSCFFTGPLRAICDAWKQVLTHDKTLRCRNCEAPDSLKFIILTPITR